MKNWWPSQRIVLGVVLALMALRTLVLQLGIDRLTTIDLWSNPVCAFVGALSGSAITVFVAHIWFAPSPGTPISPKVAKLRQDRPVVWGICGFALSIGLGFLTAFLGASLLGVRAQYLSGPSSSFDAVVFADREIHSRKGACTRKVDVRAETDGSDLTICLATRHRSSLVSGGFLERGTEVTVHVVDTYLGRVVTSVQRKG